MCFQGVSLVAHAWLTHTEGVIQARLTHDLCGSDMVEDTFSRGAGMAEPWLQVMQACHRSGCHVADT